MHNILKKLNYMLQVLLGFCFSIGVIMFMALCTGISVKSIVIAFNFGFNLI